MRLAIRTMLAALTVAMIVPTARAVEIKVIGSPGLRQPYTELVPGFEKSSGHKVMTTWGGVNEVADKVAAGEIADVVLLPVKQIDDLIRQGKLDRANTVVVAKSGVGVAVRAGMPKIDIRSSDSIKKAMLAGNRVAYSTGPSGVHMAAVIKQWGLTDQLKSKIVVTPPNTQVAEVLAKGGADLGFQQVSELLHAPSIQYLGQLPSDIDEITAFAAALHRRAQNPDAAKALIKYLSAPAAAPIIKNAGMDPG